MAGFVGTSNLLSGDAAVALVGAEGTYGIRPEKLGVHAAGQPGRADGGRRAPGRLVEVVYAGPVTRYVVDLEAGPRLIALQQNATGDPGLARGAEVELEWDPSHVITVPSSPASAAADGSR